MFDTSNHFFKKVTLIAYLLLQNFPQIFVCKMSQHHRTVKITHGKHTSLEQQLNACKIKIAGSLQCARNQIARYSKQEVDFHEFWTSQDAYFKQGFVNQQTSLQKFGSTSRTLHRPTLIS